MNYGYVARVRQARLRSASVERRGAALPLQFASVLQDASARKTGRMRIVHRIHVPRFQISGAAPTPLEPDFECSLWEPCACSAAERTKGAMEPDSAG